MATTIIGSAEWNTKGIVLTRQTSQEQINGLVNVQLSFAMPATKRERLDRSFVVDAPPPIWPSSINRNDLQARTLFMVDRSIEQANGIVNVNANYAGVLIRPGTPRYYATTDREGPVSWDYQSEPYDVTVVNPVDGSQSRTGLNYTTVLNYRYYRIVYQYQYAVLEGFPEPKLPEISKRDLYSLTSYYGYYNAQRPDIHWSAIGPIYYNEDYFRALIEEGTINFNAVPGPLRVSIESDIRPSFVTPKVKVVTVRKYLP